MNALVEILNALSVLVSAVVGAFAVTHDFKDKNGKITKWGKWAIISVLTAAVVALTTQGFRFVESQKEKVIAEKNEEALSVFRERVTNPLASFTVSLELIVPKSNLTSENKAEELEKLLRNGQLNLGVFLHEAPIAIADYNPALSFDIFPFTTEPVPRMPGQKAPQTTIREAGDRFEVSIRGAAPMSEHRAPEMSGWNDIQKKTLRVTLSTLPKLEYRISRFEITNERGLKIILGDQAFVPSDEHERVISEDGATMKLEYDLQAVLEETHFLYPSERAALYPEVLKEIDSKKKKKN